MGDIFSLQSFLRKPTICPENKKIKNFLRRPLTFCFLVAYQWGNKNFSSKTVNFSCFRDLTMEAKIFAVLTVTFFVSGELPMRAQKFSCHRRYTKHPVFLRIVRDLMWRTLFFRREMRIWCGSEVLLPLGRYESLQLFECTTGLGSRARIRKSFRGNRPLSEKIIKNHSL